MNEVRADGGCLYCEADQGESHRVGCTRPRLNLSPVLSKTTNWKQVELGEANRAAVRALLSSHLGISRTEIAERLNLSLMAVSRHVASIRAEWGASTLPTRRGRTLPEILWVKLGSWRKHHQDGYEDGWREDAVACPGDSSRLKLAPTHWMPLPSPPSPEQKP
jgi:biotin operon repressor